MALSVLLLCLLATLACSPAYGQQQSCAACNCPLDTDDDLDAYVASKINAVMGNEPLPKVLQLVTSGGRTLSLRRINMTTLNGDTASAPVISSIILGDGNSNVMSTDNIMAYRPRFNDGMNSNLAALFLNLEAIFPCLASVSRQNGYYPICRVFTSEEDGFRGGRALLDTGDIGNGRFRIFSSTTNIATYSIAIQNCPTWTTTCLPDIHQFAIVCYLPRNTCM